MVSGDAEYQNYDFVEQIRDYCRAISIISLLPRFDNVFDSDAKQNEIYGHVKSIVPNILNGQNATIFGYGPTGAGNYPVLLKQ